MCSFYALSLFFLFLYALVVHYARDCSLFMYIIMTLFIHVHVHTLYVQCKRYIGTVHYEEIVPQRCPLSEFDNVYEVMYIPPSVAGLSEQ